MARDYNLEVFRDFYGCSGYVRRFKNGSARLTIHNPQGYLIWARNYQTYRGARIAMGKLSDGWTRRL